MESMKILFFDGYCSICSRLVDWVLVRDRKQQIKFASLQGSTAKTRLGDSSQDFATAVYLRNGIKLERSTAVLYVLIDVGGFWKLARFFFVVPRVVRDRIYDLVSKNRYRLFKKRDTCRLPTEKEIDRLLP